MANNGRTQYRQYHCFPKFVTRAVEFPEDELRLTLDLPDDLASALATEAARAGLPLPDYAIRRLAASRPATPPLRTGAALVAYWLAEGLIGTRPDITHPAAHARRLREEAQNRAAE